MEALLGDLVLYFYIIFAAACVRSIIIRPSGPSAYTAGFSVPVLKSSMLCPSRMSLQICLIVSALVRL